MKELTGGMEEQERATECVRLPTHTQTELDSDPCVKENVVLESSVASEA